MIVDASALCAILLNEPEAPAMLKALEASEGKVLISPVVRMEATLRIARSFADKRQSVHTNPEDFDQAADLTGALLEAIGAKEMPISESIGTQAIAALKKYGKVAGHPAKLNMGDAFSYALAKAFNQPLLYKGNDFTHTDLA
ncbi:type II toxin-antitoxin system VapC family toxin [Salipiger sp. PrR003]|uniref:type II toxin-antitoxin system VapC family toxin n=1 Tax=Salipiger sp. PrR003 TaxID=2706776 RepID=UPI0013DBC444|nr:type II toxin-antitoxin system VapC family toxin [Salipiger sp. PrR003]NDV52905.1 type II toxin-antitoxin system VapC family toxin [Salipiger sp. PrR003]